ncbi:MAG: chromosome segregation protein SMC [Halioglobus sp.]|nr:chromosome segregation protein SMC [Halioglobus sp.]
MRLKSIKLAGFKSFVDPTSVNFPSNMCAVVGPNGCGKSNVIDAVRWVMGESSAKNLRGESMSDVIFNGSVNRQPVGQASIELVFDNSEGRVGGEFASYSEISTKRSVVREGQSEYYLNGTRCRRRDITDIFLGTGLGPRSYAIIEQGMISRLIESKPEELRVFIEEAAGISKYKERRKETESRMRRTKENLERLTDLRDELERQLQHLQRQAQAAEKYTDLKSEERELKAQLLALQCEELDKKIQVAAHAVGELEVKLESIHSEHQSVDTQIEQHRVEQADRTDAFNKVQANFYSLGSEVARIEQTIKHHQERGLQLQEDLAETGTNLEEAESHLGEDREKLTSWEQDIASIRPDMQRLESVEKDSSQALLQSEEAMHKWQHQWDEFNQNAAEPRQQAEVQQSRIQHLEQVLQRLQERMELLGAEKQTLDTRPGSGDDSSLSAELSAVEKAMADQEEQSETIVSSLAACREESNSVAAELNQVRSALQQMRGRSASLEALQQAAREDGDQGVSDWLEARQLDGNTRLLDLMQVDEGWQLAAETVLGDYLQAVCVDDISALKGQLETLQQGQLMLMDATGGAPAKPGYLASRVQSEGRADALLAGIRTAEDLGQALGQRASLADEESIITQEGIWIGKNWLRVARLSDGDAGAIRRQEELDSLGESLEQQQTRETELSAALHSADERLTQLEAQRQTCQSALQTATREHAELSARVSAHQAKTEQMKLRSDRIATEVTEAQAQFTQEQKAIAEARSTLADSIESMEADSQRREKLMASRDEVREALEAARHKARSDKDGAHEVAMRYQSLDTQINAIKESIERFDRQVTILRERKETLAEGREENEEPLPGLNEALEEQLALRLEAEGELSVARELVVEVEQKMRDAEQQRTAIEQRAAGVRSELEKRRIEDQTLQVERNGISKQLAEEEQVLEDVLEGMPEGANEADWQSALEKLANRINRLGPINLAAIDEYTLQSERKNYLDAQNEDLVTALQTLESAIRKIDKETRNRFRETFEKVNSGLGELFPRVFGGGSAYLEMTGDDLLDTGIAIMARPPGKKNATIHLLSGGEKALTAIALVFSIFQLNPAPFCILDEVDAPLDDANTGRYARLVKEMSDKVQFIYITHNKISMEFADQLMGVTMHEPGVSRLVSVDVDEAAALAAS